MRRGLAGVTRCGTDKGVQGPCIAFLSFVSQPRGRQLVGMYPPPHTTCWQPACTCALSHPLATCVLPPHLAPRPPRPSICCRVRGCSTEVRTSFRRDLVLKERDLVYQEAKETYSYMSHLDMFSVLAIPPAPREAPRAIFVQTLVCGIGP